jgi:hypothetical protein
MSLFIKIVYYLLVIAAFRWVRAFDVPYWHCAGIISLAIVAGALLGERE